jgi:hypothetical protein
MAPAGTRPWYRQFWPWFVLAPLIATVIGGFATLIIAGSPPALVVDDFGQIALAVEQDQARDRRARELRLSARMRFTTGSVTAKPGEVVSVELAGDSPEALHLHLIHPTRQELDQRAVLERAGGTYSARAERPPVRVYVRLTDAQESWRLTGELRPGEQELAFSTGR